MSSEAQEKSDGRPLASPSSDNPALSCNTFRITLSPVGDITDRTIKQVVTWLKKQDYGFAVTERGKNGKLHLHMCVCTPQPVDRENIHDSWWKRIRKDYEGSVGRIAVRVDIMYDHKWYEEYLRKEEGSEIVYDNYDKDAVTEKFPSKQQQERYIELKGQPVLREHLYDILSTEFKEFAQRNCRPHYGPDYSYEEAVRFMKHRMHVLKKQPYYTDERRLRQLCWFLYEHVNQIITPTAEDKNHGARQTGNCYVEVRTENFRGDH